ncbi:hypothetical protein EVAR_65440_1 [Eumeta japonica]|uniref:Uncharacterized protein n=1 Tax=Eumeta variegata TaxID=151549 RepID=A0A4C1ZFJ7_EUMVA|nr:hypothetical protein EVAR_65440_1 [Eumeta japonica]
MDMVLDIYFSAPPQRGRISGVRLCSSATDAARVWRMTAPSLSGARAGAAPPKAVCRPPALERHLYADGRTFIHWPIGNPEKIATEPQNHRPPAVSPPAVRGGATTVSDSRIEIVERTKNVIENRDEIENGTEVKIEFGIKVRIKSVTEIGMRSSNEIKIQSETRIESGIGISSDQDRSRDQKQDYVWKWELKILTSRAGAGLESITG